MPSASLRIRPANLCRRSARRERAHPLMSCLIATDPHENQSQAKPVNLSLAGMAFSIHERLRPDTVLYMTLTNSQCLFKTTKVAEVRYCCEQDDGTYLIGCQFTDPLKNEELRTLLA